MKRFLCLVVLLALLICNVAVNAQTGRGEIENWVEVRGICADAENYLLQVDVSDAITAVYVFPNVSGAWLWWVGETKTRRFWVDKENTEVSLNVEVGDWGGYRGDTIQLDAASNCAGTFPEDAPPVNECLGMSLDEFIGLINYVPISGGFVVDGIFYNFNERLSFFVPVDAAWMWDLYVDDRHVLRFEQNEDAACHVSEVYAQ